MNRVAIFLENFELGGRERVALKMSEALNQLDVVPDICALRFASPRRCVSGEEFRT